MECNFNNYDWNIRIFKVNTEDIWYRPEIPTEVFGLIILMYIYVWHLYMYTYEFHAYTFPIQFQKDVSWSFQFENEQN